MARNFAPIVYSYWSLKNWWKGVRKARLESKVLSAEMPSRFELPSADYEHYRDRHLRDRSVQKMPDGSVWIGGGLVTLAYVPKAHFIEKFDPLTDYGTVCAALGLVLNAHLMGNDWFTERQMLLFPGTQLKRYGKIHIPAVSSCNGRPAGASWQWLSADAILDTGNYRNYEVVRIGQYLPIERRPEHHFRGRV